MANKVASVGDVAGVVAVVIGVPAAAVAVIMLARWIRLQCQIQSGQSLKGISQLCDVQASANEIISGREPGNWAAVCHRSRVARK